MAMIAILNATELNHNAFQHLDGGLSALERSLSAAKAFPEVGKVALLCGSQGKKEELTEKVSALIDGVLLCDSAVGSFPELTAELDRLSEGFDSLYYAFADCPLLDAGLASSLHGQHQDYLADYSFADGYPQGIAPEILRKAAVKTLILLSAGMEGRPGRDALFTVIQKDINGFDIETDISPADMRPYRLCLSCDTKRNRILTENLMRAGARDAASLLSIIPARLDLHRSLPAFFAVQIVSGCPQACMSCPYPKARPDLLASRESMDLPRFDSLMEDISRFCEDAVVGLSLWGEPSLHPDFAALARSCLSRPGLRLVVETSGVGWKPGTLESVAALPGADRIDWILSLDAHAAASYERLRGPGFEEALACVDKLLALFPGRTHVQALRMEENEEELELFYRHWKEKAKNVIIQKYDHFCGLLPERKVTDLSPLERNACWHLMRDMNVLLDGRVALCREDVDGSQSVADVFRDGVEKAWERLGPAFAAQAGKAYDGICARCDEYYTYNF